MKTGNLVDLYQVADLDKPVKLNIDITSGINAKSKLFLNDKMISGPEGDGTFKRSFEILLGSSNDLNRKTLKMTTLVLADETNPPESALIISLTGGLLDYAQKLVGHRRGNDEVVKYSVWIKFYK